MLRLHLQYTPPTSRNLLRPAGHGWIAAQVVGDVTGLQTLVGEARALSAGRAFRTLLLDSERRRAALYMFKGAGDLGTDVLCAVAAWAGLILIGGGEAFVELADAASACIANTQAEEPMPSHHVHIELYDPYGEPDKVRIGDLTLASESTERPAPRASPLSGT